MTKSEFEKMVEQKFDSDCKSAIENRVKKCHESGRESTVYWATEPKLEEEPLAWSPYAPSELEPNDMHIWRVGKTITYKNNIEVMRNYIQEDAYSRFLWTAGKG